MALMPITVLYYETATFSEDMLLGGGVTFAALGGPVNGNAYDTVAGAWHPGIAISPAAVDAPLSDGGAGGALGDPAMQVWITNQQ